LEVVKSTKTDQQEQAKTQAMVMQVLSVGLKQLNARTSQLCQESAQARKLASPVEPVTGANGPTGALPSEAHLPATELSWLY
jgi:hypothetical protein